MMRSPRWLLETICLVSVLSWWQFFCYGCAVGATSLVVCLHKLESYLLLWHWPESRWIRRVAFVDIFFCCQCLELISLIILTDDLFAEWLWSVVLDTHNLLRVCRCTRGIRVSYSNYPIYTMYVYACHLSHHWSLRVSSWFYVDSTYCTKSWSHGVHAWNYTSVRHTPKNFATLHAIT